MVRLAPLLFLLLCVVGVANSQANELDSTKNDATSNQVMPEKSLNPFGRAITITSVFRTTERILGQIDVSIAANGDMTLPATAVLQLLDSLLPERVLADMKEQSQDNRLSDKQFELLGYPISLDPTTFELHIAIAIDETRTYPLSLSRGETNREYHQPSLISGYANIWLSGTRNASSETATDEKDEYSQAHRVESGLNIQHIRLNYNASLVDSHNHPAQFKRTATRLSTDFPSQGTRLTLGDINSSTAAFQGAVDVGGISITRNFTQIPTRNVRPTATQQFTLSRTSDVDVVIDGVTVQRLRLPAGRYDLNDIPLAQGSNDINLIIRDAEGNEEQINFSIATDASLLKQGEYEYVATVGAPVNTANDGKRDYEKDQLLWHGIVEAGITPSWTSSINGQYYNNNITIGTRQLVASHYGTTELSASYSQHDDNGKGHALRLSHSSPIELYDAIGLRVDSRYEYFSPQFSLATDISATQPSHQHYGLVSISRPLFDFFRIGVSTTYSKSYQGGNEALSLGSSFSGPIYNTAMTFGLNANYSQVIGGDDNVNASLNLSIPLDDTQRIVSRYQTNNHRTNIDYSYRRDTGNTGGLAINASILNDEETDADLNGSISYTANRYEISIDHNSRLDTLNSDFNRTDNSRIQVATALAFSGNKMAIGRTVGESFAIVSSHSNLEDNLISVDPTPNGSAKTKLQHGSHALVSDIVAYSPKLIRYEVENLPPGYDLGAGLFAINPRPGQGYQMKIGSDAIITLMGSLYDKETEQPIALVAGRAHKQGTEESIEYFTNRKGRFAVMGMSPGKWTLEIFTKPIQRIEVDVTETETMLIRKGVLYVDQ